MFSRFSQTEKTSLGHWLSIFKVALFNGVLRMFLFEENLLTWPSFTMKSNERCKKSVGNGWIYSMELMQQYVGSYRRWRIQLGFSPKPIQPTMTLISRTSKTFVFLSKVTLITDYICQSVVLQAPKNCTRLTATLIEHKESKRRFGTAGRGIITRAAARLTRSRARRTACPTIWKKRRLEAKLDSLTAQMAELTLFMGKNPVSKEWNLHGKCVVLDFPEMAITGLHGSGETTKGRTEAKGVMV